MNNVAQRDRVSPYKMIEVDQALDIIFKEAVPTIEIEIISYKNAVNRILAENIYALEDIPPFRAAIKDGYAAVKSDETKVRQVIKCMTAGSEVIDIIVYLNAKSGFLLSLF